MRQSMAARDVERRGQASRRIVAPVPERFDGVQAWK
jgi:hypothetical protein